MLLLLQFWTYTISSVASSLSEFIIKLWFSLFNNLFISLNYLFVHKMKERGVSEIKVQHLLLWNGFS